MSIENLFQSFCSVALVKLDCDCFGSGKKLEKKLEQKLRIKMKGKLFE